MAISASGKEIEIYKYDLFSYKPRALRGFFYSPLAKRSCSRA